MILWCSSTGEDGIARGRTAGIAAGCCKDPRAHSRTLQRSASPMRTVFSWASCQESSQGMVLVPRPTASGEAP